MGDGVVSFVERRGGKRALISSFKNDVGCRGHVIHQLSSSWVGSVRAYG